MDWGYIWGYVVAVQKIEPASMRLAEDDSMEDIALEPAFSRVRCRIPAWLSYLRGACPSIVAGGSRRRTW